MQTETYIVRGLTQDGSELFYTGRAGSAFTSPNRAEAFTYSTLEGARNAAKRLNVGTLLHGIHFMAPCAGSDVAAA